jgi:hypothetical protein
MENLNEAYKQYYMNQAGTGLVHFEGSEYQRGHGFFGNIFSTFLKPLGKYFAKKAISTGVSLGTDYLANKNMKESVKERLKQTGNDVLEDALNRAKTFAQTGKGRKRKRIKRKSGRKIFLNLNAVKSKRVNKRRMKRRRTTKTKSFAKRKSLSEQLSLF